MKRSEEGRVLISAKDCILSERNGLWDYLDKSEEPLLKEVGNEDFIMENFYFIYLFSIYFTLTIK